jgi:hypothetical protein
MNSAGSGTQPSPPGPSREDIVFGRAVIAFKLATKPQVEAAAAEQKRLQSQGRTVTLAQILVSQKLISVDQYRRIVQEMQSRASQTSPSASGLDFGTGVANSAASSAARSGLDLRLRAAPPPPGGPDPAASNGRPEPRPIPRPPAPPLPDILPPDVTPSGRYAPNQQLMAQIKGGAALSTQPPSEEELEAAAKSWEQSREEMEREHGAIPPTDSQGVRPPAVDKSGFEIMSDSASASHEAAPKRVTTPQAAKERRDAGIRKMLNVPETAEEFDFGPYRILGEVASGGMGIIYRAVDTATGTVYALKALLNVESANEKQLKRFVAEAQSAMRLEHPGIVKIYDLGVFENIPYFTMDMIPGKDLHHILREKSLSAEKVLKILKKVCEAVDYAHQQGVIHRDLKPANIIVRPDEIPVLTDFGLAKNLDSQHKLTAENAMVGTPLYLSPEQVSGKANVVDGRCDVYGLGVMLYQILTDKLPFFGRNPYEIYRKIMEEDPAPPSALNPAVSPEVEKICLMALAKSRDERYPSAKAMADDLGRFLRGEPVQAKVPPPLKKRPDAPQATVSSATPIAIFIALGVFALLILGGIVYIVIALVSTD